ncbi:MAG: hypothetical protein K6G26_12815, partial [Lachnospiraceae bacterium]|nr:hypothetical protein [Lachnospiraceae bacterium]
MIIDCHSHILPGIDDGASDVNMSMAMLDMMSEQGIDMIISTSHYYPEEQSIESFLSKRDAAYTSLMNKAEDKMIPTIKLGAEVLFSPILINHPDLHELCISGTDYLLLELPYRELDTKLIDNIEKFIYSAPGIYPIIAHAERYLNYTSIESIEEILDMDVLAQINASSIVNRYTRKIALKMIKNSYIHIIGTDAHNITSRAPMMDEAKKVLDRKISKNVFLNFMDNAKMILDNADI